MPFRPRLAGRLIVSLTLVLVIVASVSSFFAVATLEREQVGLVITGADQLSRGIVSATWQAMLANHREGIAAVIQTVATKQGIRSIRIFNKEGRVMISTDHTEGMKVDKEAEVCAICHGAAPPLVSVETQSRARIFPATDGGRQLAIVSPIYNEPACSQADCHAHPEAQRVLGMLDLTMDLREVDQQIAGVRERILLTTVVEIILLAVTIVVFTRKFVAKPIRQLIDGTRAVSAMQLDTPVRVDAGDEIQELAQSFDKMRGELQKAFAEINQFTHKLEEKVAERTEELNATNQRLIQADRLSSLGQLAASVAHEINNPLSGVLNLSMLMQRIIREDGIPAERLQEFKRYLSQVTNETARVGRIVSDLLAFSRRSKPQRAMTNLNNVIRASTSLLEPKLRLANAEVRLDLQRNLAHVLCDSSQIQQVVINLLLNAADALQPKGAGTITVRTTEIGEKVRMEVSDSGEGIPPENLRKIFDPFFTTKAEGKGSGLGLAVAYGIIHAHGGDIEVESTVGVRTSFVVTLPILPPEPESAGSSRLGEENHP